MVQKSGEKTTWDVLKNLQNDYDKLDKLPFPQLVSESRISEPSNRISDTQKPPRL